MSGRSTDAVSIGLRPADHADLDGIVAVFQGCWTASYGAVLPPELVAAMTPARSRSLWSRVLAEAGPGEVIVAVGGSAILGVTRWAGGEIGWVHSLYVDPAAQGLGIGRQLLGSAERAITAAGARVARLWVFAANAPSHAFYRSCGWTPDGTTRIEDEFGEPEIGMLKELSA